MKPETLNRLHDLRVLSQDLRREVEKDRAWQVAVHLATAETELTEAIAFLNQCAEAAERPATPPPVYVCEACGAEYSSPQALCVVCGCRRVVKSSAVLTLGDNKNAL